MARGRSPWRALRPVLLAGAATLTWLTFSSPAASADTLSDTASLLGGVTSTVSSVTGQPPAAVPPPAQPQPTGALRPIVGSVSGFVDSTVASVPVVKHVVPAGTASAVAVPLAGVADGASAGVVHVVAPPVAEALPVLEPVVEPVTDLVTGTQPLPVPVPLPDQVTDTAPLPDAAKDTVNPGTAVDSAPGRPGTVGAGPAGNPAATAAVVDADDTVGHETAAAQGSDKAPAPPGALGGTSTSGTWAALTGDFSSIGDLGSVEPRNVPAPAPGGPSSGTGSGTSSSGSSGSSSAAAWLQAFSLFFPFAGAVHAGDTVSHAPLPVSFDPGSSPD